jgi:hypothetical protein
MENQHQEYKLVKINTNKMESIHDRFYIAPNPKNMHKIALGLVKEFTSQNLPVMFKYQLITSKIIVTELLYIVIKNIISK